jgi:hypothetical protein
MNGRRGILVARSSVLGCTVLDAVGRGGSLGVARHGGVARCGRGQRTASGARGLARAVEAAAGSSARRGIGVAGRPLVRLKARMARSGNSLGGVRVAEWARRRGMWCTGRA